MRSPHSRAYAPCNALPELQHRQRRRSGWKKELHCPEACCTDQMPGPWTPARKVTAHGQPREVKTRIDKHSAHFVIIRVPDLRARTCRNRTASGSDVFSIVPGALLEHLEPADTACCRWAKGRGTARKGHFRHKGCGGVAVPSCHDGMNTWTRVTASTHRQHASLSSQLYTTTATGQTARGKRMSVAAAEYAMMARAMQPHC